METLHGLPGELPEQAVSPVQEEANEAFTCAQSMSANLPNLCHVKCCDCGGKDCEPNTRTHGHVQRSRSDFTSLPATAFPHSPTRPIRRRVHVIRPTCWMGEFDSL